MDKFLNLSELAAGLGIDVGQLSRESKRQYFPVHIVGGERRFDADEVLLWRRRNIRTRCRRPAGSWKI